MNNILSNIKRLLKGSGFDSIATLYGSSKINNLVCRGLKISSNTSTGYTVGIGFNTKNIERVFSETVSSLVGTIPINIGNLIFCTRCETFTKGYIGKSSTEVGSYDILVY